jgi:excinuclease ABC subunit A
MAKRNAVKAGTVTATATDGGGAGLLCPAGDVPWLHIRGATHNNLRDIDAAFPLGRFTCVTGVSGSGKSSLVNDILHNALAPELNKATSLEPGPHAGIEGMEHLDKIIAIDQTPIGRTPRSNPATYIKVFDEIRTLFAKLPDAKLRGYKPGRFSFNVPAHRGGGRCEACEGNGSNKIEMDFLADVWVECPVCEGRRFGRETLQIRYKGKSIGDVLQMEVADAVAHFENVPRIRGMLQTLHDVGLDYVQLGQPSPTLSGGEAQRIKLARELVKKPTGRTLYVLDEPTTGLHFEDIRKLLAVLHGFVDAGNTVVVIEHNLDVVKTADWIIDLGPGGGEGGGAIVVSGTPEEVADCASSDTGLALRPVLRGVDEADEVAEVPQPVAPAATARRDAIVVSGAREHNLKDLHVTVPRNQTTVCTGVSGSGKTSFAIDTVFTEGYRRYVESLSAYARQFLGQMTKPRVDHVEGLSPAICIEQRAAGKSPRSTVGTVTEIYDYMRVLWARVGTRMCPNCDVPVGSQTVDEIVERVMGQDEGTPIMLLAPVALGDGETYASVFNG